MTDISELMDRDPLLLSRDDISLLITEIRKGRTQYNLGAKDTAKPPKPTKAFAAPQLKLDLSKLQLIKK